MIIKINPPQIISYVASNLFRDVMQVALKIRIGARKNAPVETGAGRDSITIPFQNISATEVSVSVGTNLKYMYYQHGGSIDEFLKTGKWKYKFRHLPDYQSDRRNKMAKLDINYWSKNQSWSHRYSRGYYQARYKKKILSNPIVNPYLWDAYKEYESDWRALSKRKVTKYINEALHRG